MAWDRWRCTDVRYMQVDKCEIDPAYANDRLPGFASQESCFVPLNSEFEPTAEFGSKSPTIKELELNIYLRSRTLLHR